MPTIKKFGDSYYFCTLRGHQNKKGRKYRKPKNIFLVKSRMYKGGGSCGYIIEQKYSCPKELIGKRVRLKLEIIEEETKER